MAQNSHIEWCHHTINFWSGCTKVSPACTHCYAEKLARINRHYGQWGHHAPRAWHGDGAAKAIAKWNVAALCERRADEMPQRPRVFINSMSDWLDDEVPVEWLAKLLDSIRLAPHLDFLLLTKRPENFVPRVEAAGCHVQDTNPDLWAWIGDWFLLKKPRTNLWIGTTAENQQWADQRRKHLKAIPALCHFVSYEPALGPIDWTGWEFLKWLISGGESGGQARPSHRQWHRTACDFAAQHGIAFFFKQWGDWSPREDTIKRETYAVANDGTCYLMTDIAPGGPRRDEAIRSGHNRADLLCMYRVGKKNAGARLDGREWREFPDIS